MPLLALVQPEHGDSGKSQMLIAWLTLVFLFYRECGRPCGCLLHDLQGVCVCACACVCLYSLARCCRVVCMVQ